MSCGTRWFLNIISLLSKNSAAVSSCDKILNAQVIFHFIGIFGIFQLLRSELQLEFCSRKLLASPTYIEELYIKSSFKGKRLRSFKKIVSKWDVTKWYLLDENIITFKETKDGIYLLLPLEVWWLNLMGTVNSILYRPPIFYRP